MCLVKVKGEVEDDVIVPARVVERDVHEHIHRETQIVDTAPPVIERPSRSRRYSSSTSSSSASSRSTRSSISYGGGRHHRRGSHRGSIQDSSSYDGRSRGGRSRSRDRGYYREQERIVSGGSHTREQDGTRGNYRYVDPAPRGSSNEIRQEIIRAEEHLQRAAEIQERERRMREVRAIGYDPRSSSASHRSHSRDGRRRSEVVVVQEVERHRDRYNR